MGWHWSMRSDKDVCHNVTHLRDLTFTGTSPLPHTRHLPKNEAMDRVILW